MEAGSKESWRPFVKYCNLTFKTLISWLDVPCIVNMKHTINIKIVANSSKLMNCTVHRSCTKYIDHGWWFQNRTLKRIMATWKCARYVTYGIWWLEYAKEKQKLQKQFRESNCLWHHPYNIYVFFKDKSRSLNYLFSLEICMA